jgi:hypothetical protein
MVVTLPEKGVTFDTLDIARGTFKVTMLEAFAFKFSPHRHLQTHSRLNFDEAVFWQFYSSGILKVSARDLWWILNLLSAACVTFPLVLFVVVSLNEAVRSL